jgi:hypothetical protein
MTFIKNAGQVMGLITATINGEVRKYIFNDKGYEPLEDLLKLIESLLSTGFPTKGISDSIIKVRKKQ